MTTPRRILFLTRQMPSRGPRAREHLEAAFVAAAFDQRVTVLFKDDGVWQLLPESRIELPDEQGDPIAELAGYGITAIYACRNSLAARGLAEDQLATPARALSTEEQRKLLAAQDVVLND